MAGVIRQGVLVTLLFLSSFVVAEYHIGMTAGFTGPQGQDNLAYRYGVEAYFEQVNRNGGIKGEEIELEVLDDDFSAELAERNLVRFVNRKGVVAMLGGDMTSAIALANASQREKVLFLGSLSGHPGLYEKQKSVLNTRPSMAEESLFLCRQMKSKRIKDVLIVSPDYSAEYIAKLCQSNGVNAHIIHYSANTLNFQNTLSAVEKKGIENILLVGSSVGLNRMLEQANSTALGFHTFWLMSSVDVSVIGTNLAVKPLINQVSFLPVDVESSKTFSEYKQSLQTLNPYLMPTRRGFEGYLVAKILTIGLLDVVKPFELANPSDFLKLPLNVARRFTGWVQTGKDLELQTKLINALSVMRTFDLGIGFYPGFEENENTLNWPLTLLSNPT